MSRAANIVNQPAPADPTPVDLGVHALPEPNGTPAEEPKQERLPAQQTERPHDLIHIRVYNLEEREKGREADIADQRKLMAQVIEDLVQQLNVLRQEIGLEPWRPEGRSWQEIGLEPWRPEGRS